ESRLFDVIAECSRQSGAQSRQMGTAILLRDIVGEAKDRFLVTIGPLHRQFHRGIAGLDAEANRVRVQRGLELREMLDECADSALVLENILFPNPLILKCYFYPGVQERQLTQALGQDVVLEFDVG